jgi:RNA polymerase sigma factor (sigma-70 family)
MSTTAVRPEDHLDLLRRVARQVAKRYPSFLDIGDLISEGWFGLLRAVRGYDPQRCQDFSRFAARCMRNKMIDALRRDGWTMKSLDPFGGPKAPGVVQYDPCGGDAAVDEFFIDHRHDLTEWLDTLPERDCYILRRRYLDGCRVQEIADSLGLTKGAISFVLNRYFEEFPERLALYRPRYRKTRV